MERWKRFVDAGLMKYPEEPVEPQVKPVRKKKEKRGHRFPMGHPGEGYLSTVEAVAQLGVSKSTFDRMVGRGLLCSVKRLIDYNGRIIPCSFYRAEAVAELRSNGLKVTYKV